MSEQILPTRVYYTVFAVLMACTYLTWQIAYFDLGPFNTIAALTIAVFKAVLVILFFMHVIHSTRLTWVVVIASFLWLGVLFVLTFADYLTRMWKIY
jgi:cytochrome c oxidase subunit 4